MIDIERLAFLWWKSVLLSRFTCLEIVKLNKIACGKRTSVT